MTDATDARNRMLARIADALGCPVGAFVDETVAPRAIARTAELLHILDGLSEDEQERVVAFARALADQSRESAPPAADGFDAHG